MNLLKLHNAMWPGLVGKEPDTDHPPISFERMLDMTAAAEVNGQKYDGIDSFLFHPHTDPDASETELRKMADQVAERGLKIGTLVAPIWTGTVGGPAFGTSEERSNFLLAIKKACRIADIFKAHGVREYGAIRVDSAGGVEDWAKDPSGNAKKLVDTLREAGKIAGDHGERIAAEGEICWGGMHSWKAMLQTLEEVGTPETVGFQADLAHTYLYLLGYNAPEAALLKEGHTEEEFWPAYEVLTDALRPWTIDFHVAQNDGTVHGTGSHDKTGRHCAADDPKGKLDIAKCATYWLKDHEKRGMKHICWDGCMFSNETLENPKTWDTILGAMIDVRGAV